MLAFVFVFVIPTSASSITIAADVEEHILNQLKQTNIPNAAVAVIQNGETSYFLNNSQHDTLFQIGSLAKSFTGFGVLLLEEMGLLSVNDPINQHLPWFAVRYNGAPIPHGEITIANLLHHTSGFTSNERRFPSSITGLTIDEFIAELIDVELAFYPSTAHIYANINYIILGFLIEAVTGQSYHEFMTARVLHPLGLYNTFTDVQQAHDTGRVIGGHRLMFFQVVSWNPPITPLAIPTGFIYSSISDMARWAGIHLGAIEVSEQLSKVVARSHEHNHYIVNPFEGLGFFYGAGWGVNAENGDIGHGAATPSYSAIIEIVRHNNTAVVVLGNMQNRAIPFASVVLEAVNNDVFNGAALDLQIIFDIIFSALTLTGTIFVFLFVRLVIRFVKRLRSGEQIKARFEPRNIIWFMDLIISIIGVLAFYLLVPSIFFRTSYAFAAMFSPASITTAGIAVWIMLAYSAFEFIAKLFGVVDVKSKKLR